MLTPKGVPLRALPLSLLALLLLLPACAGTEEEEEPIVATGSTFAPVPADPSEPGRKPDAPELLDPNRILARVNDDVITVRSIRVEYPTDFLNLEDMGERRIQTMLQERTLWLLSDRLLIQKARELGAQVTRAELDAEIAKQEKEVVEKRNSTLDAELAALGLERWEWRAKEERRLLSKKFIDMLRGLRRPENEHLRAITDMWVRPVEIRRYYDRHPEEFQMPAWARVEAIFIRVSTFEKSAGAGSAAKDLARAAAGRTVARARAGEDFDSLMAEFHEKPLSLFENRFGKGEKAAYVEDFVWSAEVGAVSEPVDRGSGFLIFKLAEKQEARVVPFEEARPRIEGGMRNLKGIVAQHQIQLVLLRESVVTPRVYKIQLEKVLGTRIETALAQLSK
jgi:hypothetical protein